MTKSANILAHFYGKCCLIVRLCSLCFISMLVALL